MIFRARSGFTLAEVLLTLAIIGIVASMTIPALINNIGDQATRVTWKKDYATFSQATLRIQADNSSLKDLFTDANSFKNQFTRYVNYTKSCTASTAEGCWLNDGEVKYLMGWTASGSTDPGIVLANGGFAIFWLNSSACAYSAGPLKNICGNLTIDVNGHKGPNIIGKDIFSMWIVDGNTYPFGVTGDGNDPSTSCVTGSTSLSNLGLGCSALYLTQ